MPEIVGTLEVFNFLVYHLLDFQAHFLVGIGFLRNKLELFIFSFLDLKFFLQLHIVLQGGEIMVLHLLQVGEGGIQRPADLVNKIKIGLNLQLFNEILIAIFDGGVRHVWLREHG